MKKLLLLFIILITSTTFTFASVSQTECKKQGDNFIFAGGECIQYAVSKGDTEDAINVIVHGTWKSGTNTLGRYAPFAETLAMNTDITTIAVALPGYSKSSTNHLKDLNHVKNNVYTKGYIDFMANLIKALKEKFHASTVNYMRHSAGATLGANLIAKYPGIVNTLTAAGGHYSLDKAQKEDRSKLYSIGDHLNKVGDTKILLIYGTADTISKPKVTTDFYKKAKDYGLNVKLVKVEGAPHLDLDMSDKSVEAFTNMVAE